MAKPILIVRFPNTSDANMEQAKGIVGTISDYNVICLFGKNEIKLEVLNGGQAGEIVTEIKGKDLLKAYKQTLPMNFGAYYKPSTGLTRHE